MPNGGIYISTIEYFLAYGFDSDKKLAYPMPPDRSIDIDSEFDFQLAQYLIQEKRKTGKRIKIGDKHISKDDPCFIIAEAGINHNGDLQLAKKLVDSAKDAGADAVKFQTFKAEDVVSDKAPLVDYQIQNIGSRKTQLEMLKEYELSYGDFEELKRYCDKRRVIFLSTPHSWGAADFLEPLVPAYKIGSADITNVPFLKHVAEKRKPVIFGTGMSTLDEVREALNAIYSSGNSEIIALHCTSRYPCPPEKVNMRAMTSMQNEVDCLVGYSDHTRGLTVPIMAVTLGAVVIEKHITIDRDLQGPDHNASLEPREFKSMVDDIRESEMSMGNSVKIPTSGEIKIRLLTRKSIVTNEDLKEGMKIKQEHLSFKRPGDGLSPAKLNKIIGRRLKRDIKKGEKIKLKDLESI
jgi:N-acetylneuraminate synthase